MAQAPAVATTSTTTAAPPQMLPLTVTAPSPPAWPASERAVPLDEGLAGLAAWVRLAEALGLNDPDGAVLRLAGCDVVFVVVGDTKVVLDGERVGRDEPDEV